VGLLLFSYLKATPARLYEIGGLSSQQIAGVSHLKRALKTGSARNHDVMNHERWYTCTVHYSYRRIN
jgi:hypothetical protein